jgi:bifunctional UDP-N-acetylglucosamine pyrophosphorylase/glucosamine-1-phosphate N-acetyltransferase
MNPTVIIMAGGLGKRMGSDLPKVVHPVKGVPMIVRILRSLPPNVRILVVVGKYKDIIQTTICEYTDVAIEYVVQDPPLGTGHAIACCLPHIEHDSRIVVLSGDVPLIRRETIEMMIKGESDKGESDKGSDDNAVPFVRVLTMTADDPTGYGRIITDHEGYLVKIVEHKDCSLEELAVTVVNCGIYAFSGYFAHHFIPLIQNENAQREYYLTDIVELATSARIIVEMCPMSDEERHTVRGINTLDELLIVETMCTVE